VTRAWVLPETVLAIHDRQIAEHGGAAGVRDLGLLESALARPRNLAEYWAGPGAGQRAGRKEREPGQGSPDVFDLAAAYAFGLVRNHPFVDGNKRTAWITARLFLSLNHAAIVVPGPEAVLTMVAAAAGELDEAALAALLRGWQNP